MNQTPSFEELSHLNKTLDKRISTVKNYSLKRDLLQVAKSCENCHRDISQELVNCCREKKLSTKYHEFMKLYIEHLDLLNQLLVEAIIRDD